MRISIFAFTKVVLERRYLEMIAPQVTLHDLTIHFTHKFSVLNVVIASPVYLSQGFFFYLSLNHQLHYLLLILDPTIWWMKGGHLLFHRLAEITTSKPLSKSKSQVKTWEIIRNARPNTNSKIHSAHSLSKNGNISCDLLQEEKCVVSHEYYTSNAKINNIHLKK